MKNSIHFFYRLFFIKIGNLGISFVARFVKKEINKFTSRSGCVQTNFETHLKSHIISTKLLEYLQNLHI